MDVIAMDRNALRVNLADTEASRLLAGLESMRSELGLLADELITLLHAEGVRKPTPDEHIRFEYAGPE
jgi:hypothetical protein